MDSYKDIPCLGTLLQELEATEDFHPLTSIKKMKPGEGLTKIWMCPSEELATILFRLPQVVRRDSANILKEIDVQSPRSSATLSSLALDDSKLSASEDFSESSSDSWALGLSDEETERLSEAFEEDDRLTALRQKLKRIYKDKVEEGADKILMDSLVRIENQMCDLVADIRKQEKKKIDLELTPLMHFIEEHQAAVNRENSLKLRKKFRDKRRSCISRIIDVAEENFTSRCIKLELDLKGKFLFKVKKMKNQRFSSYKDYLKEETEKLSKLFTQQKDSIMMEYEKSVESIKNKYNDLYEEMKREEELQVQEQVDRYKEKIMEKKEKVQPKEKIDPRTICSKNSAWLCVMHQLLCDMERFITDHIKEKSSAKALLKKREKSKREECIIPTTPAEVPLIRMDDIRSYGSVPCVQRDENTHRKVVREAHGLLIDIINEIAKSGKHPHSVHSYEKEFSFASYMPNVSMYYQSDEDHYYYQVIDDVSDASSSSFFGDK